LARTCNNLADLRLLLPLYGRKLAGRRYSYRSASIGLIRDALTAGYAPNKMPTATETPKATTTDAVVTIVFHSAVCAISHARKHPNATPSTPPPTEIRIDSVRN